jgi:hypothetical protein
VTFDVIFARLWLPLKRISIEKAYIGQLSYTIPVMGTHSFICYIVTVTVTSLVTTVTNEHLQ